MTAVIKLRAAYKHMGSSASNSGIRPPGRALITKALSGAFTGAHGRPFRRAFDDQQDWIRMRLTFCGSVASHDCRATRGFREGSAKRAAVTELGRLAKRVYARCRGSGVQCSGDHSPFH